MLKKIRNYLFAGLIISLPLFISITITVWIFKLLTNGVISLMPSFLRDSIEWQIIIRLLTLIGLFLILFIIGMFTKVVFLKKIFSLGEKLLIKIPLFNAIYLSLKQISHAFLSEEKTVFNKVVAIEYPRKGLYSVGFITSRNRYEIHEKTRKNLISIFIPTSPNPTSGLLVYAPEEDVIELDMTVEQGMKLVISGGALTPN